MNRLCRGQLHSGRKFHAEPWELPVYLLLKEEDYYDLRIFMHKQLVQALPVLSVFG